MLHAQILRSTVLGQSLLNASPRLLAALPPLGTSSFISVPQNLSHTSSNPQPTGVNGSFKSFFPALPANTFNSQSLTTSHVDGVVNTELQTSSHLPKVTPRVLEIKTRSPDSHTLVLNIPSVPSIIVAMEIILMLPIPHQDIAEMVQQKLYISPPRQRKTPIPAPASMVSCSRVGAEVSSLHRFIHIWSPFLISRIHIFYLPTASCTCPDPSCKPWQGLISPSPHSTCKASTPLFITVCMNKSLSSIPRLPLALGEPLGTSCLPLLRHFKLDSEMREAP